MAWVDDGQGGQKWVGDDYIATQGSGPVYKWNTDRPIDPNNPDSGYYAVTAPPMPGIYTKNNTAAGQIVERYQLPNGPYDYIEIAADGNFYPHTRPAADGEGSMNNGTYDIFRRFTPAQAAAYAASSGGQHINQPSVGPQADLGASMFGGIDPQAVALFAALTGGAAAGIFGDLGAAGATAGTGATAGGSSGLYGFELGGADVGASLGSGATGAAGAGAGTIGNYVAPNYALPTGAAPGSVLASGGGYTGAIGTVPGVGTITAEGMIIPAAGGAAVPIAGASSGMLSSISSWIKDTTGLDVSPAQLAGGALNTVGGLILNKAGTDAANTAADKQLQIAKMQLDANKLKLPNVSGNIFGTNSSTYDANGLLTGVSSTAAPWLQVNQDALKNLSGQQLQQYLTSMQTTAPMLTAGQNAMTLGNKYLSTDPATQAAKYMADQQALVATGRERDMSQLLTGEQNRGTLGLSVGGTSTGMMGSNPRLEALMNAQRQQDLGLAANATQGGMDYAKFGAGMVGTGGDLTGAGYALQDKAFTPYGTTMTALNTGQGYQDQALNKAASLGSAATAAAAAGAGAYGNYATNATNLTQKADSASPWGALLTGAGNTVANYAAPQAQTQTNPNTSGYMFNPYTGTRLT